MSETGLRRTNVALIAVTAVCSVLPLVTQAARVNDFPMLTGLLILPMILSVFLAPVMIVIGFAFSVWLKFSGRQIQFRPRFYVWPLSLFFWILGVYVWKVLPPFAGENIPGRLLIDPWLDKLLR